MIRRTRLWGHNLVSLQRIWSSLFDNSGPCIAIRVTTRFSMRISRKVPRRNTIMVYGLGLEVLGLFGFLGSGGWVLGCGGRRISEEKFH